MSSGNLDSDPAQISHGLGLALAQILSDSALPPDVRNGCSFRSVAP